MPTYSTGAQLKIYRQQKGLSLRSVAENVGVDPAAWVRWEDDTFAFDTAKLPDIIRALDLNDRQIKTLLLKRLPALDPNWLANQEREKRGGLLLTAYYESIGMKQHEFARQLGLSQNAVSFWCRSERAIPDNRLPEIIEILGLNKPERKTHKDYFIEQIAESNKAIKERHSLAKVNTNHLGSALTPGQPNHKELHEDLNIPSQDVDNTPKLG